MKGHSKVRKYIIQSTLIVVMLLAVAVVSLLFNSGNKEQAQYIVDNAKTSRDVLFTNTINGTMMYVPVSNNEGIAEATGNNGEKGYYLFTQLGDTVTISDDIMISNQQNLYDMMLSIIKVGKTHKEEEVYITTIKGTAKIIKLLTEKWKLTEGQTLGALANYGATNVDDARLELQVKSTEGSHFEFAINIYVEDKAYVIYRGVSFKNNVDKAFPPELYAYRSYEGMRTDDARAFDYLVTMTEYFKEVAILLNKDN